LGINSLSLFLNLIGHQIFVLGDTLTPHRSPPPVTVSKETHITAKMTLQTQDLSQSNLCSLSLQKILTGNQASALHACGASAANGDLLVQPHPGFSCHTTKWLW